VAYRAVSFPRSTPPDLPPRILSAGRERQPRMLRGRLVTTATLTSHTCKWPIGDPAESGFHYCGHKPEPGRPYCELHEKKSYSRGRSG
jgi:GcrA cell cycle regulator